ncbi:uncharacterized protein CC84DRAFT_1088243 [Paraphaeosphaeria sporulosa]|uniref:DUF7732 domain-containing protein n=1 Tax=Paraphaeosphaeria sporulosa TaxID=1460663 RepID=A0A177CLT0_9PLEO|nr:uncharacterized protein CC84DRAFT_1088243 [Paraphaeosphaeria sporulosa]OAG07769.1 hypothetical protein CC84DRAFT_1088243 [Paraphaeosphaeria sporulosa]
MRLLHIATYFAFAASTAHAVSVPNTDVKVRDDRAISIRSSDILAPEHTLEKRKGGGGKGGGGGSSSSRASPASNAGGATVAGSGPSRSFGGGGYYGGGASTPYKSGSKTPKGLVAGAVLAPVLLIGLLPGLWLYSVYPYYFHNPYRFINESAHNATNPNGTNSSLPVTCLCEEYSVCGCDENDNDLYLKDLVGNGSYDALNKTLVNVADVNGTRTLILNGTLPNGTTAPGGTDDAGIALGAGKYAGWYAMGLTIIYFCAYA